MLARLRQLRDQVLQALEHNARAASVLLELAARRPPGPVHRACHGPCRSGDAVRACHSDCRHWPCKSLEIGE